MSLTKEQLKANEDFFNKIASLSSIYAWPSTGHVYKIEKGVFICDSIKSFEDLKNNTPKSFHHKIRMK
jgi:hypothetical protein